MGSVFWAPTPEEAKERSRGEFLASAPRPTLLTSRPNPVERSLPERERLT